MLKMRPPGSGVLSSFSHLGRPINGRVATSELYSTRPTAVNDASRVLLVDGEDHDASACARRSYGADTLAGTGGDRDLIRGESAELLQ